MVKNMKNSKRSIIKSLFILSLIVFFTFVIIVNLTIDKKEELVTFFDYNISEKITKDDILKKVNPDEYPYFFRNNNFSKKFSLKLENIVVLKNKLNLKEPYTLYAMLDKSKDVIFIYSHFEKKLDPTICFDKASSFMLYTYNKYATVDEQYNDDELISYIKFSKNRFIHYLCQPNNSNNQNLSIFYIDKEKENFILRKNKEYLIKNMKNITGEAK